MIGRLPTYRLRKPELGTELVKVKRLAEAVELFDAALEQKPTLTGAKYNRACALMLMGKVDEARLALADLASQEHTHVEPLLNYSALLLSQNADEEAVAVLHRATSLFPMHAPTWHNYGTALKRTGNPNLARKAFRRALSLNPRDVSTAVEVAKCLIEEGEVEHAVSELRAALRHSTMDGPARELLSQLLVELGRADEAVVELDAAVWTGATVEGRFVRAWALATQKDYVAALAAMQAYIASGGQRLEQATISRAIWLLRLDRPAEALAISEQGLQAASKSAFLHAVAALAAVEMGLTERANELSETAVRLDDSSLTRGVRARTLSDSGDTDAALECAIRAVELDPANPDAKAVAAVGLLRTGRPDEAWPLLESAIADGWEDSGFFRREQAVARMLAEGSVPPRLATWMTDNAS